MWQWICGQIPKPTENGSASCFRQKIRNSSLFRRTLHMDLSYSLIMQSLLINVPISIIRNDEGGLYFDGSGRSAVEWPMPEGMTKEDLINFGKDHKWGGIKDLKK